MYVKSSYVKVQLCMQKDIWDFSVEYIHVHGLHVWHESSTYTFGHNMIFSFDICQIAQLHKEMTQGGKKVGMERSLLGFGVLSGFFFGSSPCMTCFSLQSRYGEATSKLGVFSSFSFISLHTCFVLPPMMGLSPRLFDLLFFRLLVVAFCAFECCLLFGLWSLLLFSFLLCPCQVFFLSLFINL